MQVDHLNGSAVQGAIVDLVRRYESEATSPRQGAFIAHISAFWRKFHHTVDAYFGSSFLHFILAASTLEVISLRMPCIYKHRPPEEL
jgi:hypothetical protein